MNPHNKQYSKKITVRTHSPRNHFQSQRKRIFLPLLVAVSVAGIAMSGWLYSQHRTDQKLIRASASLNESQQQKLVQEVSHLILLPGGERPTIATVSDYHKLQSQPFFSHAANGDKVLIYAKARTAILYDPRKNIVVAVAPLGAQSGVTQPAN